METLTEARTAIAPADYTSLYEELFPVIARWVSRKNGSLEDARDLFHDALIIFLEKGAEGQASTFSRKAYVTGIVRHLWYRKSASDRRTKSLGEGEVNIPDDYFPSADEKKLLGWIEQSGKRCLELLSRFYFERHSLTNIASSLGYRNEHSASVQKYKCIEKIRETLKQKSVSYEDLIN